MDASDLKRLNGSISAALKRRRAFGAEGADDPIVDAILIASGLGAVKIGRQLTKMGRLGATAATGPMKRPARSP